MPILSYRQREINRLLALRESLNVRQGVDATMLSNLLSFPWDNINVPANVNLGSGIGDQPFRLAFKQFVQTWVDNAVDIPAKIAELDILIADVTNPAN